MTDFASLTLEQLRRFAADPRNEAVRAKVERRIAEMEASGGEGLKVLGPVMVSEALRSPGATKRRGVMNRTEARYAREVLDPLVESGQVVRYEFEPITWHVHEVAKYTPDFVCWLPGGGLWMHEVKGGHIHEKDRLRYRAHAKARPWHRWTMVQWKDRQWTTLHDTGDRNG